MCKLHTQRPAVTPLTPGSQKKCQLYMYHHRKPNFVFILVDDQDKASGYPEGEQEQAVPAAGPRASARCAAAWAVCYAAKAQCAEKESGKGTTGALPTSTWWPVHPNFMWMQPAIVLPC
jgi:hypothetical protein